MMKPTNVYLSFVGFFFCFLTGKLLIIRKSKTRQFLTSCAEFVAVLFTACNYDGRTAVGKMHKPARLPSSKLSMFFPEDC